MAFRFFNPNPCHVLVGDCSIRACSLALSKSWVKTHSDICALSNLRCNMPSANVVWGEYLNKQGFRTTMDVPFGTTVRQFCDNHPRGTFVLGLGTHVVTVIDGDYYDIWDSGDELVSYYFV